MSDLTAKISVLNEKLAGVEDEIKLSQSQADEYSSKILELQEQWKNANAVVLEIKDKKRQILNEISALISLDQAEVIIEPNIYYNPIEYLGLKNSIRNICTANNLIFIGDLVQETETDLIRMSYFGKVTVSKIIKALESHGLKLGTKIENWIRPVIDVK